MSGNTTNTSSTACVKPSAFSQFKTLVRKDIQQELASFDMLTSMGIYAVLIIVVYGTSLANTLLQKELMPLIAGLFWSLIVFTSLLGLGRSFYREQERGALSGILLVPMDRSIIYAAKVCTNVIFIACVEVIIAPLFFFFFMTLIPLSSVLYAALVPLLLGTLGMAGVGVMLATITCDAQGREVILAVLFIPLIYPLLYCCVTASAAACTGGAEWFEPWLLGVGLSLVYDVIMLGVCWILFEYVVSN